jgi:acyl dehydratase
MTKSLEAGGPFFDDLEIGEVFTAPALTLTDGLAAAHRAVVGGRLPLALDTRLSTAVTGRAAPFAPPTLVWDVAIGQSSVVTQRVIANLFYRGLRFRKAPAIGDTLTTTTRIVGLRPLAPKPDRPPRGLAVLHIRTSDQHDDTVLDFHRCAMLPARQAISGPARGDSDIPEAGFSLAELDAATASWTLEPLRRSNPEHDFASLRSGGTIAMAGGEVVSSAPELARLTLNIAAVHHDRTATPGGRRLVYGGHTIDLAAAQLSRALPALATIVAWHGCDHLAPVHEGDTLFSDIAVERLEPRGGGGGFVHLRSKVAAVEGDGGARRDVLDWRLVALLP